MHDVAVSRNTGLLSDEPVDAQIAAWLTASLDHLSHKPSEVSVRIVDEQEIASLNAQYRGKEGVTNVLSFPAGMSVENFEILGDIVICSKVVKAESDQYGKPFVDRYAHMLVHGLLHLMGYDHMEEVAQTQMEQMERELLSMLGMESPYE